MNKKATDFKKCIESDTTFLNFMFAVIGEQ